MKAGERKYWTPPREKALLKLGKKAETAGKYKDWMTARELCPKESEILADRTNEQLRKEYPRVYKSANGMCAYSSCESEVSGKGHRYCTEHRHYMSVKAAKHVDQKRKKMKEAQ